MKLNNKGYVNAENFRVFCLVAAIATATEKIAYARTETAASVDYARLRAGALRTAAVLGRSVFAATRLPFVTAAATRILLSAAVAIPVGGAANRA